MMEPPPLHKEHKEHKEQNQEFTPIAVSASGPMFPHELFIHAVLKDFLTILEMNYITAFYK